MKGTLDILSYLRFSLSTLKGKKLEDLNTIREEFLKNISSL